MRKLKLFFACMLLTLLSIGQVWGATATIQTKCWGTAAQSYQTDVRSFTDEQGNTWKATGYGVTANTAVIIGKGGANYLETPEFSGNITSVAVTWSGNTSYYLALQTTTGTELEAKSNPSSSEEQTFTVSGAYKQLRLVGRRSSGTSNAQATISKVVVTYESLTPATPYTVTLMDNSATLTEESAGTGVTLPSRNGCEGYTFVGWTNTWTAAQSSWTTDAPEIIPAGAYNPAADENLYPVYTKVEISSGNGFSGYTQIALGGTITDGQYLISTGSLTMAGSGKTGASFTPGSTEKTEYEYTISVDGDYFTILGPDNKYVGGGSSTSLTFANTVSDDTYKWKYVSTGIQNKTNSTRHIKGYQTDFRHYASNNGTLTYLYKRTEGGSSSTTYYISVPNCAAPGQCVAPTFNHGTGTYNVAQSIELATTTEEADIYYTLDGTVPSKTNGSKYTAAFSVSENTTVRAIAIKDDNADSDVAEAVFTFKPITPTITKDVRHFMSSAIVTIECETAGAAIHYTVDGSDPLASSPTYSAPFEISATTTVKAIAVKTNWGNSDIASETFTKATVLSVADARDAIDETPAGINNQYVEGKIYQIDSYNSTYHSIIYWISDDGTSTNGLKVYSGKGLNGADFSATTDLSIGDEVIVSGTLMKYNSDYEFDKNNEIVTLTRFVASPTFSPEGAGFLTTLNVSLETTEVGGEIRYTVDGSDPTSTSDLYSEPIELSATTTIKAATFKGEDVSAIITKTYTKATKINVTDALAALVDEPIENQCVYGVVSTAPAYISSGKLTYSISVNGEASNQLKVFNGKGLNGANFVNKTDLQVGDLVTIFGTLKIYNEEKEFDAGNYLLEFKHLLDPELEWSETSFDAYIGQSNTFPSLTNSHSLAVTYSSTETDYATISNEEGHEGEISLVAVGTTTIKATFAGNDTYKAGEASYTLNVYMPANPGTITYEENGGSTVADVTTPVDNFPDPLPEPTKENNIFAGWWTTSTFNDGTQAVAGAPMDGNVTLYAKWTEIPVWAYTYTSNVTISSDVDAHVTIGESTYDAVKANKASTATITLPQGVTMIHLHLVAWSGDANSVVTVTGACFDDPIELTLSDHTNVSGGGTTYDLGESGVDYYFSLTPDNAVAANEVVTIKAASGKRFVLFGVNAVYPAAIELSPDSYAFGEVSEASSADYEFTITPNAMVTGDLVASIVDANVAGKFTVGAIANNKVTVTFTPGEEGNFSAKLRVAMQDDASVYVDADLTGTGISSATPEITLDKDAVAFGSVKQETTPATQSVAVTLANIDEDGVTAALSGTGASAFSIDKTKLTADGSIEITPNTTTPGEYSATLTFSATGAMSKTVTVTMTVVNKWAYTYSSNVDISGSQDVNVTITENEVAKNYDAVKINKGADATITIPVGTTHLYVHMAAWNGEAHTVTISGDCFNANKSQAITADAAVSGSGSTYDIDDDAEKYFYEIVLDKEIEAETDITISAASGKRFVLFGVNQEGGTVPVLDHIAIDGTMTNTTGWKTGDDITPVGLTVNAYYTLDEVLQDDPVDVTSSVVWSHDALVVDQTEVTLTATYTENEVVKSANTNVTINAVEAGEPTIITSPASYLNFGASVEKDAVVAPKTITVTLKNIAGATATLGGTNYSAFSIDDTEIVDGDVITVSVSTATVGVYAGTVTIKDNDGETQKVINLSMTVVEPVVPETAVSTTSKWIAATDADLVDGKQVLITGIKTANNVSATYAMGSDRGNNRAAVAGTLSQGVFTPGANTMAFTLVDQGDGTFALRTSNGKYLYAAHSSSNYLKTRDEIEDGDAKWTLTATSAIANGTNTNETLRFNSTNNPEIFSCYADDSKQSPIALYVKQPKVIDQDGMTEEDVNDNDDVEIAQDKTWTVNNEKTVGDVHMQEGAIIANSANVTTNDLFFKAKAGKSNQIFDLSKITVNGSLYYDFQLCNDALDANYWYSISVPFDVDLNSGVFQTDGTPLVNHSDFEVWSYNTQKRADTQYNGWERVTDNKMHAGKAYLIGFNEGQPNVIRLKAAADWKSHLFSGTSMQVVATTTGEAGDHDNWNGLANPTGRYIDVSENAQVFNNNTHQFDPFTYDAQAYNFVVGTAFFVQSASAVTISNYDHHNYRAPQREGNKFAYAVQIMRQGATEFDNQMIIRASEDATNSYEQGHDMLTMNNATSNTAAMIWTVNYGGKRLAIEEAPLVNDQAIYDLGLYAPAAGTYSISAQQVEGATLYVTYNGAIVWNLSLGDYELDLTRGTTTGYGLLLVAQPNQMPTGLDTTEGVSGDAVQKILLNGQLYILRDGHLFDAVGHEMK